MNKIELVQNIGNEVCEGCGPDRDCGIEPEECDRIMNALDLLNGRIATLISKWFKKGQESVKRKNKSGCTCIINDDDEVVSVCGAHQEWHELNMPGKDSNE